MLPITVATEDELSEAIALRVLADFPTLVVGTCLRRGGNGICAGACAASARLPITVLS
jgi:hypothetical protein